MAKLDTFESQWRVKCSERSHPRSGQLVPQDADPQRFEARKWWVGAGKVKVFPSRGGDFLCPKIVYCYRSWCGAISGKSKIIQWCSVSWESQKYFNEKTWLLSAAQRATSPVAGILVGCGGRVSPSSTSRSRRARCQAKRPGVNWDLQDGIELVKRCWKRVLPPKVYDV